MNLLIWFHHHLSITSHFRSSSFRQQTVDYSISTKDGPKSPFLLHSSRNETPTPQLQLQCKHHLPPVFIQQHWGSNVEFLIAASSVGSSEPPSPHRGLRNQLHMVVFTTGGKATIIPPPSSPTPPRTGDADAQKQHKIGFTDACAADAEQPATWNCAGLFIEVRSSGANLLKRMTQGRLLV